MERVNCSPYCKAESCKGCNLWDSIRSRIKKYVPKFEKTRSTNGHRVGQEGGIKYQFTSANINQLKRQAENGESYLLMKKLSGKLNRVFKDILECEKMLKTY